MCSRLTNETPCLVSPCLHVAGADKMTHFQFWPLWWPQLGQCFTVIVYSTKTRQAEFSKSRESAKFRCLPFIPLHYYNNVDVFVIQNWLICLAFSVCHCQLKVSFFILLLLFPVVRIMSSLTEILGRDFLDIILMSVTYSRC